MLNVYQLRVGLNGCGSNGDVDDNALCILRTRSGAIGTSTASWTRNPGEENSTIVYGAKGILQMGVDPNHPVTVDLATGKRQVFQVSGMQTNSAGGQTDSGVINAFVQAIQTGVAPEISGEEGHRALAVILACLESSRTGRHIPVNTHRFKFERKADWEPETILRSV